ncbi:MAG TPA: RNase adapter RapZ [Elusimicrobia bacterium]|nr:RNase adapter RapZ [Elusimicrobiota bacterium]
MKNNKAKTEFFIITGISGAGKSQAINCFEDLGFFCVDNLPLFLVDKFVSLSLSSSDKRFKKIALGIDIREGQDLSGFPKIISGLVIHPRVIFMDASDSVLLRRFSETRRKHPIGKSVAESIRTERKILSNIKAQAAKVIDTSDKNLQELKENIADLLKISQKEEMKITIISFGYKYGIPADTDIIMDVRFLPNPYYIKELKQHTGNEKKVKEYVMGFEDAKRFVKLFFTMLSNIIPKYVKEGKSYLSIAFGCTGGKHRSVVLANILKEYLVKKKFSVILKHRDIDK